jgi:hypothetical protein
MVCVRRAQNPLNVEGVKGFRGVAKEVGEYAFLTCSLIAEHDTAGLTVAIAMLRQLSKHPLSCCKISPACLEHVSNDYQR